MASKIILKKSSVAAKAPVAGDLDFGELAINYTDSKLYFKKADGSIDAFVSGAASAPVTSVGGNIGDITDAQLLASIKSVDGSGSGLDADLLDGNHASDFYLASNPNGYTSNTGTVTSVGATTPLVSSGGNTPSISIPAATASANGYMSSAYAAKLDGIAAGAQVNVATNLGYTASTRVLTSSTGTSVTLPQVTTSVDGLMIAADKTKLNGIATGATANTGTVTSVATSGSVNGLTLTGGTITTTGTITLGGTLSASIDNITDEHRLFNNMGDNHSTRTGFDANAPSYNFGWRYVQGSTNGPGTGGSQFYSLYTGLGNDYPATGAGSYGMFIAIDRNVTTPYLSIRYNESNVLSSWRKIYAGGADILTTARTLTVGNTGKTFNGSANVAWSLAEIGAYAATNPSGYTSNTGTVTSVGGTGGYGGLTLSGTVTTSGNLTLGGTPTGTWPISVSGNAATATSADQIDGIGFRNTGSNSAVNADTLESNGVTYYTSGVTNFSGNATDGALYSQAYSSSWQHQIAGDYRSGQIALRGKNSGTWQAWRTVLDSSNYNTYAPTKTGTGASGTWGISITGNAATITNQANSATITASTGITGSHIVQRDANGYIYANHINFNTTESENPTISSFITSNGDGWSRKSSLAHVKNSIRGVADGTWGINITGSAGSASTATTSTFVSSPDGDRVAGNKLPTSNPRTVRFDFAGASSVTGATGNYAGVMTYAPWDGTSASTGDSSYQLAFANQSGVNASGPAQLLLRNGINSTWNAWQTILSSSNFNSYSPTLTGTGASGTWGINITGNAATATTLATARTIQTNLASTASASFNGSANVTPGVTGILPIANGGTGASTLAALVSTVAAALYPVGSIYTNANNSTNPSTLLGFGTWVAFGAGRVPVGFDAADSLFNASEKTGGSKDATLVSHTHTFSATTTDAGLHNHGYTGVQGTGYPDGANDSIGVGSTLSYVRQTQILNAGSHNHTISGTTAGQGTSSTNGNLQPYITVYMWKRTA